MNEEYFPAGFISELSEARSESLSKAQTWPKISIVMPSFNQARFIERSILTVLNQGYPNTELIVIDGGSSDGTVELLKKYDHAISYWVSEKDNGQSDALNKGFARATGDFYGWLNSDDLYAPGAFHKAASAFRQNPKKKVVFGDWLSIDESDSVLDLNHAFDFSLNHFKYEGFHLNSQSMFWRAEVHQRFGGFDVDLYNTMDYQMILEFGINEGDEAFLRLPDVFGAFRRYAGQKTSGFTARVLAEHKSLAQHYRYTDKYELLGNLKRKIFRVRRASWYLKRGGFSLLAARLRDAYANRH
jgi:glycosyltransferase involved in cell wall biosynthesis